MVFLVTPNNGESYGQREHEMETVGIQDYCGIYNGKSPTTRVMLQSYGFLILGAGNANTLILHGLGFRVQDLALPLNMIS